MRYILIVCLLNWLVFSIVKREGKFNEFSTDKKAQELVERYNAKTIRTIDELRDELAKIGFVIGNKQLSRWLKQIKVI
jgi:transposase